MRKAADLLLMLAEAVGNDAVLEACATGRQ
jgi:hypothetical protein